MTRNLSKSEKGRLVAEANTWEETAKHHYANELYYRHLLVVILGYLGPEAYTCDDGTISNEVLVAKAPELVKKLVKKLVESKNV